MEFMMVSSKNTWQNILVKLSHWVTGALIYSSLKNLKIEYNDRLKCTLRFSHV